jgi:hypothetical protein
MERLIAAPWPGNVRHLEHFIEQAVVLAEGDTLTRCDLPEERAGGSNGVLLPLHLESRPPLHEVERRYILETLQHAQGNRRQAAQILRISVRCKRHWGFEPVPVPYQYVLLGSRAALPNVSPSNPRMRFAVEAWKRLPLQATKLLGPSITRYTP